MLYSCGIAEEKETQALRNPFPLGCAQGWPAVVPSGLPRARPMCCRLRHVVLSIAPGERAYDLPPSPEANLSTFLGHNVAKQVSPGSRRPRPSTVP